MEVTTQPTSTRATTWPRVKSFTLLVSNAVAGKWHTRFKNSRFTVLTALVSFFALQASLNWAIQTDRIPVRDPVFLEKIDIYRRWLASSDRGMSSVVALGSSRTQLAFDAKRLGEQTQTSTFNFGCSAAGPLTCSLYFRRLLNEPGRKPDCVFVEMHPGFLSPINPPFESRWLHSYRLQPNEVDLLREHGWNAPTPSHHGWKGHCASAYFFRFALLNRYSPRMLPCPFGLTVGARTDEAGFVGGIDLKPEDKPRALQLSFEQYAPAFPGYTVGGAGPKAIRDILQQAKQHKIRAALLLMPESSEFRGWYGDSGYASITSTAEQMASEFQVPLFDARKWLKDEQIADGHHLSTTGAVAFTDKLAQEAKSWLRGSR